MSKPPCKDCGSLTRPRNNPGPRCFTCWKTELKRRNERDLDAYLQRTYGITSEEYWQLYEFQGGTCYICKWAKGKTTRLAVDHDHSETAALGQTVVRGLLCKYCNRMLGQARDNPEFFDRAADYLRNPPYAVMKGQQSE